MKKLTVVAAALLVLALAAPSNAGIDEGDWEVAFSGSWVFADVQSSFRGEITLGYFVTPEIEIGGFLGYTWIDWDGKLKVSGDTVGDLEATETFFDIGAFGAYYFETDSEWAPYIGGFIGYESGELDFGDDEIERDGFLLGIFIGVKYFVSEKTTVFFEYRLTYRTDDEWELKDDSDVTVGDEELAHLLQFGISFLF